MSGVTDLALSVLLGGVLAAGVLCALAAAPRWHAASLVTRIAPYVRDAVDDDAMPSSALPRSGILPAPLGGGWGHLRSALLRTLGDTTALSLRIARAGLITDAAAFRGRQLGWALTGFGAGSLLVVILLMSGRMSPPAVMLPVVAAAVAALSADLLLSARVKTRMARLTDELPTTLEFLALCLSAGEGFFDALRRVATVGSGELTQELQRVVLAVGTGSSLASALDEMDARLRLPGLSRAVDQINAALEHGAPLAGVLHAQATDAREDAKRVLIEQAGKREIFMLLPSKIVERYLYG